MSSKYEFDFVTCRNNLALELRYKRGKWLGAWCNTLVPLKPGVTIPLQCPFCKARVV